MPVADVYVKLAGKVGGTADSYVPEIISKLASPEEGEMMLALPATPKELGERFQMDEDTAKSRLDDLVMKGLVFRFIKEGQLRYFFARTMGQLGDATHAAVFNHRDWPVWEEVLELWEKNSEKTVEMIRKQGGWPAGASTHRFRVIPEKKAVKDDTDMLPYEDTEAILRNAPAIAVVNCPCRMYQVEHGLNDKPLLVCLQLTEGSAKYAEEQGIGKRLTLEEGVEVLRLCEDAGLIPSVFGGDKLGFICNCDGQGCGGLRVGAQTGYFNVEKSRYQSSVNQELCDGCQICVERCIFGAIEMVSVPGSKKLKAQVNPEKCYGCGACVIKCPVEGAITLKLLRPKEHIPMMDAAHLQV